MSTADELDAVADEAARIILEAAGGDRAAAGRVFERSRYVSEGVLSRNQRLVLRAMGRVAQDYRMEWVTPAPLAYVLATEEPVVVSALRELTRRNLVQFSCGEWRLEDAGRELAARISPSGVINGSAGQPGTPRFGAEEHLEGGWR